MRYKILYHLGENIGVRTKVRSGVLSLEGRNLIIDGKMPLSIPLNTIRSAELFRMHEVMTMIKLLYNSHTLYVSVPRLNLFGLFVIINYFKTRELHAALVGAIEACARTQW
jgi:hypothetical protein